MAAAKAPAKTVSPRMRRVLTVLFVLVALIGVNSAYLAGVTLLEWLTGRTYQDWVYLTMFLAHLALGTLILMPFLGFAVPHMLLARNRRNRRAVRVGYALFAAGIVVLLTGVLLVRIEGFFDLRQATSRTTVYWLHVLTPLVCVWLYWLHRLVGPRMKTHLAWSYLAVGGAAALGMVLLHTYDPRDANRVDPSEGARYFEPSLARTSDGSFIPANVLMMDRYCMECHTDAYNHWFDSVHHFSSFNNPAYRATIREARQVFLKRDGDVQASRWCAGCHDPVPFLSGAFDNPNFDDVHDVTASAGVTCTTCHAITEIHSARGNADFVIEQPQHYPWATSDNAVLHYLSNQLVKAKPSLHKRTFLKPLHKSAEFCSTCHKVHLPKAVTDYKDFLRGQNHYDAFLLSGVSGHGARSFYYQDVAKTNCSSCHMPLEPSNDFGARLFAGADELSIHNHLFPSANTGVAHLREKPDIVAAHDEFHRGNLRVDLFGVKSGGTIDGELTAPLRPDVPTLEPGKRYLLETVIRTLKLGHLFTQGTVDSNEVWLEVTVTSGGRVIGRSGGVDEHGEVDPWSHFVNVFMLDREGRRIDRRNAQDIFVPLYNHQIPPGAGQVVHFGLELPDDLTAPVVVDVKLQYRKFDYQYMKFVAESLGEGDAPLPGYEPGQTYRNDLPVTTLATDRVVFPVAGIAEVAENAPREDIPLWQRWNDYGIGLLLEGQGTRGELRQAENAFQHVEKLDRYDGPLNLARVYVTEGRLDEAADAVSRAVAHDDPLAPPWTVSWLSGVINRQQGHLDEAEQNFRDVVDRHTSEMAERHGLQQGLRRAE
ncbi:MAG: multiheme c-type cytochrome [Pirellulales bacterium]